MKLNVKIRSYYELWNKDRSNDIHYFQYALLLSSSDNTTDRAEAITHLNSMLNNNSYRRDALYSIALCHYSLKEYDTALSFCEELYRDEPDNAQVNLIVAVELLMRIILASSHIPSTLLARTIYNIILQTHFHTSHIINVYPELSL
jgi:tetratricopeptide (TPR) repeat protein